MSAKQVQPRLKPRWWKRRSIRKVIRNIVLYIILLAGAVLFLFPFFFMISTSLKSNSEIYVSPPVWIPHTLIWKNYPDAVGAMDILLFLRNTLIIVALTTIGVLFSNSLVGYSFARLRWPGRDALFIVVIATMMVPGFVTMIPVFIIFAKLKWIDTFLPLIVPAYFGSAFYIFMVRQFYTTIPMELSEAAKIDGCSELRIYSKIIFPLSRPVLAVMVIFTFIGSWNDFFGPLIYIRSLEKRTLAIGLYVFLGQHGAVHWQWFMAYSTLMLIPVIILFFLFQKYYIRGIVLTAGK